MRIAIFTILTCLLTTAAGFAGEVKGTITYEGKTIEPKYAYMITGPDVMEPEMKVRILILSAKDLSAKIGSCDTVNCSAGGSRPG